MVQSSELPQHSFDPPYPAPPRLHWAVLLVAMIIVEALIIWIVPRRLVGFVSCTVMNAWPIYLCLSIRRIDPHSKSIFWLTGFISSNFALDGALVSRNPHSSVAFLLQIASSVLGLVSKTPSAPISKSITTNANPSVSAWDR